MVYHYLLQVLQDVLMLRFTRQIFCLIRIIFEIIQSMQNPARTKTRRIPLSEIALAGRVNIFPFLGADHCLVIDQKLGEDIVLVLP